MSAAGSATARAAASATARAAVSATASRPIAQAPPAVAQLEGQAIVHDPGALRALVGSWRRERPGLRIALVPTMGALHRGHLTLCARAKEVADVVLVSVFVNPAQFAPHEDLASYPRTLAADCRALAAEGVDLVYAPNAVDMYPADFQTTVAVTALARGYCSLSRPHFFGGVAIVVLKLLNQVMPDVAIFGEKDWQQLQIVRRMVRDLDHPTEILGAPLVRDDDGLALSSRNAYLDSTTRANALALPRALARLQAQVAAGATDCEALVAEASAAIQTSGGQIDYLAIADPSTLQPLSRVDRPARALAAVFFGTTRLLDNVPLLGPAST